MVDRRFVDIVVTRDGGAVAGLRQERPSAWIIALGGDPLAALTAGADDHLPLPFDQRALDGRMVVAERALADRRQLRQDRQALWRLHRAAAMTARTDSLTGLGNRRRMDEELSALTARAGRYGHGYWLALGDIDNFKRYNDRYGHRAGDAVLAGVARALRGGMRRGDAVFRYGGEEFLAVVTEGTRGTALAAAERLRRRVADLGVPHEENQPAGIVTMSIGLAPLRGGLPDAIEQADRALYRAKATGRNRVVGPTERLVPSLGARTSVGG